MPPVPFVGPAAFAFRTSFAVQKKRNIILKKRIFIHS